MGQPQRSLPQVFLQAIVLTTVQALLLWVFLKVLHWNFFASLVLAGVVGVGIWYALVQVLGSRASGKGE